MEELFLNVRRCLSLSLGLSRHGASQPAGAGGCNRELPGLPVAVPQR